MPPHLSKLPPKRGLKQHFTYAVALHSWTMEKKVLKGFKQSWAQER
jgi:hypothetical protein